ncbi:conserved membrane hypothetical protein [Rhodospirillaceae bacterium LM-1]|nr:conserved membrane hypothetical protein [Rhodospirillaceae bacterium LM-1]
MSVGIIKFVHIVAVCIFVGSIPCHIILGIQAERAANLGEAALLLQTKFLLTTALTGSGLVASLISGLLLALKGRVFLKARWLAAKIALAALISLNGVLLLTPLAGEMAELAATAQDVGPRLAELRGKEGLAGAINLASILALLFLVVVKPSLGQKSQRHG